MSHMATLERSVRRFIFCLGLFYKLLVCFYFACCWIRTNFGEMYQNNDNRVAIQVFLIHMIQIKPHEINTIAMVILLLCKLVK